MGERYWEEFYLSVPEIKTDMWLEKYKFLIKARTHVLDLGCGNGTNEKYLEKIGIFPEACDISNNAIKMVNKSYPMCKTKVVDMSKNLPYEDEKFEIIIADLSLHYFDSKTTIKISKELKRVLTNRGFVIGRVNSKRDIQEDEPYEEIEENYYNENGCFRRYFSRESIARYFEEFDVLVNRETATSKYGQRKHVIEFLLQKVNY